MAILLQRRKNAATGAMPRGVVEAVVKKQLSCGLDNPESPVLRAGALKWGVALVMPLTGC